MSDSRDALDQIVELARKHQLSLKDIRQALDQSGHEQEPSTSVLTRILSYLGGILIFSGVSVYTAMFWGEMNSAMRVIITLGTGIVALILAVAASKDSRFLKTVSPLLVMAAILETSGWFVLIHEYFDRGGDPRHAVLCVMAIMFIQQLLVFSSLKQSVLLFFSHVFGITLFLVIGDLMDIPAKWCLFTLGTSLLCIQYHLDRTPHNLNTPAWFLIGSLCFFTGLFQMVENSYAEWVFLLSAIFMIYLSTLIRSNTLLLTSTLSLLWYIAYFTAEHFAKSVGWPVCLIILGMIFLGISGYVLKLKKKHGM